MEILGLVGGVFITPIGEHHAVIEVTLYDTESRRNAIVLNVPVGEADIEAVEFWRSLCNRRVRVSIDVAAEVGR